MRRYAILLILVVSVVTITILGISKQKKQYTQLDRFQYALQGALAYLPEHSHVSLKLINANQEAQFFARYTLVGRVMYYPEIKTDTVLIIANRSSTLSAESLSGRKILWRNEDSSMAYFLTCSR